MNDLARIAGDIRDERAVQAAFDVLSRGGVVVLPTDTIHGLSAVLSAEEAVRRISTIKRSALDRRYILLASSLDMAARYVASFGCASRQDLSRAWPAPLTVIVPSGVACPPWIGPTVAIRVPALDPLRALVERLGEPVVSTSANRSAEPPLDDVHSIRREFGADVDLILTGDAGTGTASTIVDLCGDSPHVVRRGSYAWASGEGKPSK